MADLREAGHDLAVEEAEVHAVARAAVGRVAVADTLADSIREEGVRAAGLR